MNPKKLMLAVLLIACIASQPISLDSWLKAQNTPIFKPTPPPFTNYYPIIDSEQNVTISQEFVPCLRSNSCGEAKAFTSDQDLKSFIEKNKKSSPLIYDDSRPLIALPPPMPTSAPRQTVTSTPSTVFSALNTSPDHSQTNNQVTGVDQADLLKTDGSYIYTISNKILSIISAYPANRARVVSKISFKDLYPSAIFIEGDNLAVFGTQYSWSYRSGVDSMAKTQVKRPTTYTWVKIYDIFNRAAPYLIKQYKIQGNYFDGRKLDNGFVYLITNHYFNVDKPNPWYDFGEGDKYVQFSSIFYYPTYNQISAVNIFSFNLRNPYLNQRRLITICAERTNIMYMSKKNIYLTTQSYENGEFYTYIRKIFVYGTYIKPFADGKVRGRVNNQFSLDEYGSILRVATTVYNGTESNSVYCLDYFLNLYGSLTNIAPDEKIYSARYVGLRLYLVTFRQVDPFFVISFSNHRRPKILGQLKIPGFSRYLHPYDETTIIGFGRDVDENNRQMGLKIGLFDVSDTSNPKSAYSWSIQEKYAYSSAEWEHKAFLFSADKNLLVVPANSYQEPKFNGALAFYINQTYVELRSIIDHVINPFDNFYQRNVQRSLYIENFLYTKSPCLLIINKINKSFDAVKYINIPCKEEKIEPEPEPVSPFKEVLNLRSVILNNLDSPKKL